MKILSQCSLFDKYENKELGDLEQLQTVLDALPDDHLIHMLYEIRGKGRNDWPCEAMWNSFIASFLFEHSSINSLLRELRRNSQLREICGFTPKYVRQTDGTTKIYTAPSISSYSKFLTNLTKCQDELNHMFTYLVHFMYNNLDRFGEHLMVDGKAIQSFATKLSESKKSGHRGEHDADHCQKTYTCSKKNGEKVTKTMKWFGFRMHLIADARYELPVEFRVTKASTSENKEAKEMLKTIHKEHPDYLEKCRYFMADKGYDDSKLIHLLENINQGQDHKIKTIIDIRNCWKDGEKTHQYRNTNLVYDYKGDVWYIGEKGKMFPMIYKGFDKESDSLRYGFKYKPGDKRIFRIKREEDRRIFTPVGRQSKKWKHLYNERSGIERINGRIDRDYQFEKHTIRGLAKMTMFLTVTFLIYLTLAEVKVQNGERANLCRKYA